MQLMVLFYDRTQLVENQISPHSARTEPPKYYLR